MYCDFYHLNEKPFNITPDPKFLYLNSRYREALATLGYGIKERKGFITLIGEAGTGKTTLLNKLLDQLDEKTKTVFIFNTNVTFEEILEYIFNEFDLPVHSGKKLYMLQRLNTFLLEELRGGGNVAVLIDEAQDLDIGVLENLRLLSNLETAKEKILQIVLSGQPELEQKLSSPELRQLRQRIAVNCRLKPLMREELSEYIEFRLQAAGCADPKMFTREAEEQVWHISHGIPRLVNVVCDNALVIGYALGKKRVGADIVSEASADLIAAHAPQAPVDIDDGDGDGSADEVAPLPPPRASSRGAWALFGLVLVALLVGFLSMGRRLWPHPSQQVAQPSTSSERTIMHPGQHSDEVPPAQLGVERPNAARRDDEAAKHRNAPSEADLHADEHSLLDAPASARAEIEPPAPEPAVPPRPIAPAMAPPAAKAPEVGAGDPPSAPVPRAAAIQPIPPAVAQAKVAPDPPSAGQAQLPEAVEVARVEVARQLPAEHAIDPRPLPDGEAIGGGEQSAPKSPRGSVHLTGAEFDRITVRDGDSFAEIAVRKYGQSSYTIMDLLKLANPDVEDINRIAAGQTLELPRLSRGFPIVQQEGHGYGVLALSTPVATRAQALAKALRARGFAADMMAGTIGPGRNVQRVIIGPYASEEEAVRASTEVQRAFREDDQLAALGRS